MALTKSQLNSYSTIADSNYVDEHMPLCVHCAMPRNNHSVMGQFCLSQFTPTERNVYYALERWGCPVHFELLTSSMNRVNTYYNNLTKSQYDHVYRALLSLYKQGVIRRTNPGAYSAFSKERD